MPKNAKKIIIPCILFLLSMFIFGYRSHEPFLLDQSVQRILMSKLNVESLIYSCPDSRNPFLYMIAIKASTWVAGQSDFAARIPGIMFAALSVVLVYMILRCRVSLFLAICGAVLTMTSPQIVEQSREITTTTIFMFFSLLSTHFLFQMYAKWSHEKPIVGTVAGYLVATLLMACSNYFFVFVLAAQTIYTVILLISRRACHGASVLVYQIIGWMLCVPLIQNLYKGYVGDLSIRELAANIPSAVWGGKDYEGYLSEVTNYFFMTYGRRQFFPIEIWIALFLIIISLMFTRGILFKRGFSAFALILIAITVISNVLMVPYARLQPYYIMFLVPFAWSLWILGLDSYSRHSIKTIWVRYVFLFCTILFSVVYQAQLFTDRATMTYKEASSNSIFPVIDYMLKTPNDAEYILIEKYYLGWFFLYHEVNNGNLSVEDIFYKESQMDDDGLIKHDGVELSYRSLRPWRNIKNENDMYQKEYDNFKRLDLKRYWFVFDKYDYVIPIKDTVSSLCKECFINESFELYYCDLDKLNSQ